MNAALNSQGCNVAVVIHRIGPYHFARLQAAGRRLTVTAVEVSRVDEKYAWDEIGGSDGFTRLTVYESVDSRTRPAAEVCERIHLALDQCRPDVVAIPGWSFTEALAALQWCTRRGKPAVVMSDSTVWDAPRVWWKEWIKRRVVGMCSAGFVAGTPHAEYLSQLGVPRDSIYLGYDVVDNPFFRSAADKAREKGEELRKRGGLPQNYFLASARFVEKKNLAGLLQAFALYRELMVSPPAERPASRPWKLVLVGDGRLKVDLCSLITKLSIKEEVLLPGFKQYHELPIFYALASGFVHASTEEQWGLVVNEAMASRLPVLVSNRCGCASDLVREGINGFSFDPYNLRELAEKMMKLTKMETVDRLRMGVASVEIIEAWGPEQFATALGKAAVSAISRPRPRPGIVDRTLLKVLLRK